MRGIILPDISFGPDTISGTTSLDNAGTASRDVEASRAVRPVENLQLTGMLKPNPFGTPEADVDLELILRTPGNTDGARYGMRTYNTGKYRGKQQASVLSNIKLLYSSTSTRVSRPKLLPLSSNQLLLVYLTGTIGGGVGGTGVAHRVWRSDIGWSNASGVTLPGTPALTVLSGVDVVQFPDTGEIVMMVLGYISTGVPILMRLSSAFDSVTDITDTLPWSQSTCKFKKAPALGNLSSMAIETLPSGRIAMLVHAQGPYPASGSGGLWRAYSDDRGVTWSAWQRAGQFGDEDFAANGTFGVHGGVSIARARTGSLVAMAPGMVPDMSASGAGWTAAGPAMRLLVSDDGDGWNDAITINNSTASADTVLAYANALAETGINEGAVALGDDGLVRLFGCFHGDSGGSVNNNYFDDLVTLCLAKPDVTAADVGRRLTRDQVSEAGFDDADYGVTCSDILDGEWEQTVGAFFLNKTSTYRPAGTFTRMFSLNASDLAGSGGTDLDGSPDYRGARMLDVVNFRGALWMVVAGEDTGQTRYSLIAARTLNWCEQLELPALSANNSTATNLQKGRVYQAGWLPTSLPNRQGWTLNGTAGNATFNTASAGLKIDNTDTVATFYSILDTLPGGQNQPTFLRFTVVPESGGSLTADDIMVYLQLTNGVNLAGLKLRFSTTQMRAVDAQGGGAGTTIATTGALTLTYGIEVIVRMSAYNTLEAILYRTLAQHDQEDDGAWTLLVGTTTLTTAAGAADFVRWGNQTTTPAVSTWRNLQINRARAAAPSLTALELNELALNDGPEFDDTSTNLVDIVPGYDDGVRHGSRAPVVVAEPAAWLWKAVLARWVGAAGVANPPDRQDRFRLISRNDFDIKNIVTPPVSNIWRSEDDTEPAFVVFDGGSEILWRPQACAFFKCNAEQITVEFETTNSWPGTVSITCNTSDDADVRRDHFRRTYAASGETFTVEGTGDNIIRITGETEDALTPHMYRSDDRVVWYAYSSATKKVARVLDNDERRIVLDVDYQNSDFSGSLVLGEYIAIYPDRIVFDIGTGGVLGTIGYAFMRFGFGRAAGDTEETAEGYFQLGYVVAGRYVPLDDPHPDWGWSRSAVFARAELDNGDGYVDVREAASLRWRWDFGFGLLRPPKDRGASLEEAPGDAEANWERWFAAIAAMQSGQVVAALLPEYSDQLEVAGILRCLDVYPVRFRGELSAAHQFYQGCRDDGLTPPGYAVQGGTFEEIY